MFRNTPIERRSKTLDDFKANEHITILDLPVEIILNIISWVPYSEAASWHQQLKPSHHSQTHSIKALRLTCKILSRILVPVLLNSVVICGNSSAREFLEWCRFYTAQGYRIPVRRLSIGNVGHGSSGSNVPYDAFEDIVTILAPKLHQLKIEFEDCFEFSDKLAYGFRQAESLWVLHVCIISESPANLDPLSTIPIESGFTQLYDPGPFFRSLMSLPNLIELHLNNCFDYCAPLDANYELTSLPRVQHLSANFDRQSTSFASEPYKALFLVCRAIADSLLIFEIKGSRYDSSKLLPILATTQYHLEALHLSDISLVQHCNGLEFPRLRTFELDDSRYLVGDEFNLPLFEKVTTFLLRRWSAIDMPLDIPIEIFRNLRRVILTYTPGLTPDAIPLLKSCEASSVDLLSSARSVDLREIWAIDAMEADEEYHNYIAGWSH